MSSAIQQLRKEISAFEESVNEKLRAMGLRLTTVEKDAATFTNKIASIELEIARLKLSPPPPNLPNADCATTGVMGEFARSRHF